jgi:putative two-component system response regulator
MTNIQAQNYYKYGYEICRHHHERYDGKGYPDGLVGDEIPLESQIVSVADVFDALTSKRCYKPAYSCEKALDMINNGECGVFSEKMLECVNSAKNHLFKCANRQYKIDV